MKKLLLILTKRERLIFCCLTLGMFLTMVFELLGISLVIPISYGLTQKNFFEEYSFLSSINEYLDYPSTERIILLSLVSFFFVYVFKNIYLLFFYWFEGKFIFNTRENVSSRLYKNYLNKDYIHHVNENSANIVTRLKADIHMFQASLIAFTTLLSEIIVFLGLTIFLLMFETTGVFFIAIAILIFVLIFYLFFFKKVKKNWRR